MIEGPSRQSLVFQLVGRDELPNAIALNSSLFNAARAVGPALGGVLIAVVGVGWCFMFNAVSFMAVLITLLLMRSSELFPIERDREPQSTFPAIREGLSYVWSVPLMRTVIISTAAISLAGFNFRVLVPSLAVGCLQCERARLRPALCELRHRSDPRGARRGRARQGQLEGPRGGRCGARRRGARDRRDRRGPRGDRAALLRGRQLLDLDGERPVPAPARLARSAARAGRQHLHLHVRGAHARQRRRRRLAGGRPRNAVRLRVRRRRRVAGGRLRLPPAAGDLQRHERACWPAPRPSGRRHERGRPGRHRRFHPLPTRRRRRRG